MVRRVLALAAFLLYAAGCSAGVMMERPAFEPIAPPGMRPIGDALNWQLLEPMTYRVGDSTDTIVVPVGFVTDFASIPDDLQSLISPLGPHVLPAIVHDYLYWNQTCTRAQADEIFLLAMEEMNVPWLERRAMYFAVRLQGQEAWEANAAARRSGLPRIVPGDARRARPLEVWDEYRRALREAGVPAARGGEVSRDFCSHGG